MAKKKATASTTTPKPRQRRKKFKTTSHTGTLRECLTDYGEVEGLKEEIEEWHGNMESNGMDHMPKYEELQECLDALEAGWSELETVGDELVSAIANAEAWADELGTTLTYYTSSPYGRRSPSRALRLSNSCAPINCGLGEIEDWEVVADTWKASERNGVSAKDAQTQLVTIIVAADELQQAIQELDNVEFPGMFG